MTVSIIHVLMVEHVKMVLTLTCVNVWRDSAETIVKIVSCYFICIRFIFLLIFVVTYLLFLYEITEIIIASPRISAQIKASNPCFATMS